MTRCKHVLCCHCMGNASHFGSLLFSFVGGLIRQYLQAWAGHFAEKILSISTCPREAHSALQAAELLEVVAALFPDAYHPSQVVQLLSIDHSSSGFAILTLAIWCRMLCEVHESYQTNISLAEKGYWVYDFALPLLILHAFTFHTAKNLRRWLTICPRRQITVLDTHDGMGIDDISGLAEVISNANLHSALDDSPNCVPSPFRDDADDACVASLVNTSNTHQSL